MLRWMLGSQWIGKRGENEHADQTVKKEDQDSTDDELAEPKMDAGEDEPNETESEQLLKAPVSDWVTEQRRRKWRWAGHVVRLDAEKWQLKALNWYPEDGSRRVGRPARR